VNLLPDEPAADRNAKLAALKARLGDGTLARIEPQHDLAGRFIATCAKGTLTGTVTLTPGPRPQIQTLEVRGAARRVVPDAGPAIAPVPRLAR
jgi:hypothetical protein